MKVGKTLLYVLIAAGLIGGGAYIINKNQKETQRQTAIISADNAIVPVNIITTSFETVNSDYASNGTFAPLQQMQLSSEIAGKVTRVLVKEGDYVRAGQTLATVKKDALEVDRSTALASYQNAVADNQRFENAYKTGGVTKQQLDQSRLQLKNAKNTLEQSNIRVGDSNIKTLVSGYINKKTVEPGAVVAPGTPLFEIVNTAKLKLQVTVNESEVANLRIGDKIKIKVSVYPDKEFEGRISFIAPLADTSLNFPIEIMVDNNPNNELRAGMYGTAVFSAKESGTGHALMTIPKDAFIDGVSNNNIFVVQPDNTVKLVKIVSGKIYGDKVEVISGLKAGEKVVTSGQINLSNGTKITVIK
ncbi:efflux RND transporter periplasmic adaptor subunit [Elizabethkingia sp. JS20170427COW]|uniref:efflux RND transporter periplasmic adaptor subunit n=1 Tax=Elizabethkingia sp. JS20170427COW TaxID=2583851 RepID=UPI001110991F|nr:efflux RND transporter periplasmic adaptor subunit [Elizabethkingia sp. JS20170427COW]QCX53594.1 efflux RND transporter periplasmic adaptor subunit [Elizabethkingia sp. JS20170427COW]